MIRMIGLLVALLMVLGFGTALAQVRQRTQPPPPQYGVAEHKAEIHVFGGYRWTFSRRVTYYDRLGRPQTGDLDIKDGGFWAIALDLNLHPAAELELLYDRQESKATFKTAGVKNEVADLDVEYWQIGAVKGIRQGKVKPFGSFSLGATHYKAKGDYDGGIIDASDWQFSMILGLGVKYYASERIGVRAQARLPFTFTSTGLGIGCGWGGCGATVGGTGIAQIDLSGGLYVMF